MATFSVSHPFNSKYDIFISSAPKVTKYDLICLWKVYAFLNQVLLQEFENFSLTAKFSHFYELLFIGPELRMLSWQSNIFVKETQGDKDGEESENESDDDDNDDDNDEGESEEDTNDTSRIWFCQDCE